MSHSYKRELNARSYISENYVRRRNQRTESPKRLICGTVISYNNNNNNNLTFGR